MPAAEAGWRSLRVERAARGWVVGEDIRSLVAEAAGKRGPKGIALGGMERRAAHRGSAGLLMVQWAGRWPVVGSHWALVEVAPGRVQVIGDRSLGALGGRLAAGVGERTTVVDRRGSRSGR